jgi:hypothetical protein
MIDENALGALIAYAGVEDDEYTLEREAFVARFQCFRDEVLEHLREAPLAARLNATDLGHALYFEMSDDATTGDPIAWLRGLRARLAGLEFFTIAVLTHGSRWVFPDERPLHGELESLGDVRLLRVSAPSEPLRRALAVEAVSQPNDGLAPGWGPGLYVDTDALEALGRSVKNAPTALEIAGATFYRAGS